jgi:peptidylprolyl isomerase
VPAPETHPSSVKVKLLSRRLRRLPILLLPLVLATTLVACGDDSDSSGESSSSPATGTLDGVEVEGEPGKAPEVTWDGKLEVTDIETTVLTKGEGEEVAEGDQVQANLWIGNGFTQKQAYSSYDDGGQPETVTASADLAPVFKDAVLGQTIGSRVAVTATADDAFGPSGNPQLGIGNKDTVLIIVDLIEMYVPPEPTDVPQSEMPKVVEKKGEPTGFDFSGVAEPKADGDLLRTVVKEGEGETITSDMTIEADYLGAVYDAKKPFDESYSKEPVEFALSGVVKGWTYGLTGVKVGSRVLLSIPPDLGYGSQEQAGIPANSTLYFVVDVISAK